MHALLTDGAVVFALQMAAAMTAHGTSRALDASVTMQSRQNAGEGTAGAAAAAKWEHLWEKTLVKLGKRHDYERQRTLWGNEEQGQSNRGACMVG